MKKTLAILLCLTLLGGVCGFALRSPEEAQPELVEEVLDAPAEKSPMEEASAEEPVGEPSGDVSPEPVGEMLDDASDEPENDGDAVSLYVKDVGLRDGQYLASNDAATPTDGFVYGTTTDYVAGYAGGVLYLNGFSYSLNDKNYCIIADDDLTIVLAGVNTAVGSGRGVAAQGNLTIRGDGSLITTSSEDAIFAHGDITVEGGTITATATYYDGIFSSGGDIVISGGTVNATGGEAGIAAYEGTVTIAAGAKVTSVSTGDGYEDKYGIMALIADQGLTVGGTCVAVGASETDAGRMTATDYADAAEDYLYFAFPYVGGDIWVNGVELADGQYLASNDATAPTDGFVYGTTAAYVAGYEEGELYLNGANITRANLDRPIAGVRANDGLWITLLGANTITGDLEYAVSIQKGDLRLRGTGSLTAYGSQDAIVVWNGGDIILENGTFTLTTDNYDGLYSSRGDIVISGGNVNATGPEAGIAAYEGDITISGDAVVVAGGGRGIYARDGAVTIESGTVTVTGDVDAILAGDDVTVEGGTITATATDYDGIYAETGDIVISGGTVNATGGEAGIAAYEGTVAIAAGAKVTSVSTGDGLDDDYGIMALIADQGLTVGGTCVAAGTSEADAGRMTPADYADAAEDCRYFAFPYVGGDIWVNGVELADGQYLASNDATAPTDGFVYGTTAAYVAGYEAGELYLNGANITRVGLDEYIAGVVSSDGLWITLLGANTITGDLEYAVSIQKGDLRLRGTGSLTAYGSQDAIVVWDDGDIILENGTFTLTTDNYDGLYSSKGDIVISGGNVNATGPEAGIAAYKGDITISGDAVVVAGGGRGIYARDGGAVTISDRTNVTATGKIAGIYAPSGSVTVSADAVVTVSATGYEEPPVAPSVVPSFVPAVDASADGWEQVSAVAADGGTPVVAAIQAPEGSIHLACDAVFAGADKASAKRVATADYLAALTDYLYVRIPYVAPVLPAPAAKVPSTGDSSSPLLWLAMLVLGGGGAAVALLPRKKRPNA